MDFLQKLNLIELRDIKNPKIGVALDVSGTISEGHLLPFLDSLFDALKVFEDFELVIWNFDTRVHNHCFLTKESVNEFYDNFELIGGGGTDYSCYWEYLKYIAFMPDLLIIHTDGYALHNNYTQFANDVPTLFVCFEKMMVNQFPFGRSIYYPLPTS